MDRLFYPAIFHPEDDGGYSVVVPDIDGCFSEGDTLDEAYEMAFDAVGLCLEDALARGINIPSPSDVKSLERGANDIVAFIAFNWLEYRKKHDTKSVKKTLTIPSWLNAAAEERHINFSSVLQNALINMLDNQSNHTNQ